MSIRTFDGEPVRAIDGDTVRVTIDLGFNVHHIIDVRIAGINTPEIRGGTPETKAAGRAAQAFTAGWLAEACDTEERWPLTIRTSKGRSFNRWVGTISRNNDSNSLAHDLLSAGHAEVV